MRPKRRGLSTGVVGLGLLVGLAGPAMAQSRARAIDLTAPTTAPPRSEFGLERGMPSEQQGSREQEFYPGRVRSRHEPAFVRGLAATVAVSRSSAVRVGLSGWTAPALPFDFQEATGGLAFGLSLVWDVGRRTEATPEVAPPGGE